MSRKIETLTEKYIQEKFAKEDVDLIRIRDALKEDGKFGINVGAVEGKILQFLVGLARAKSVVEIGVLYGYSTIWIAKALPADGKIYAIEKSEENFKRASELIAQSQEAAKIELIYGDALEEVKKLTVQPDVVFIDANKAGYRHYLDWAMDAIVEGGLIIGDNTFLFGQVIGEDRGDRSRPQALESMNYFNNTLAEAKNFRAIALPTYEGMTLAQKLISF